MIFSEEEWRAWRRYIVYATPTTIGVMVLLAYLLFTVVCMISSVTVSMLCEHETWMSYDRVMHDFVVDYGPWIATPVGCGIAFLWLRRTWKSKEPTLMFLEMWRGEPVGSVTN